MAGLREILSEERVSVAGETEGVVSDKPGALSRLAQLLANGSQSDAVEIERMLREREALQSTGVGDGVAVPHACVTRVDRQVGAVLVCPKPVPFDAIDGAPVSIFFALIGPKGAPAEHLKILARVSRLLREPVFRARLAGARAGGEAYRLIVATEGGGHD